MARFRLPRLGRRRTVAEHVASASQEAARAVVRRLPKPPGPAVAKRKPGLLSALAPSRAKPPARKSASKSAPPSKKAAARPPTRRELKAQAKAQRHARREARLSGVSFLGYVLLAAMIVAVPTMDAWRAGPAADPHDPKVADAAEPRRGRAAHHPFIIPASGWRDIITRVAKEFGRDRIMATAAGVTFFTLLSLFPAIGAFVSLYGLFSDVGDAQKQLHLLAGFLPHDILSFVGDEMIQIASTKHPSLGFAFAIGLLLSIWSTNGAMKALFDGLNVAYEERESRSFLRLTLTSLAFTFGSLVFLIIALVAIVSAPALLARIGLDAGSIYLTELRWPVIMVLLVVLLSLLYRFGPSRAQARWVWLTPGSLFAAVMWVAASLLFSWYVASFGTFSRTYGSLGAVIAFMTWLWYSTIIVLVGAELNAEVEHQTAVDTTTGHPLPMGVRGARMADTLGAARGSLKEAVDDRKAERHPPGR